ncbi:MAG TPA: cytochrome c3 family protein [Anaeromyxobacteraceae bacterium]|jgi:predicted CXXCH cytochrome family protein
MGGRIFAPLLAAAVAAAPPAAAASDEERTDAQCLECHAEPWTARPDGRSVFVDPGLFAATTHAAVGCTTCHASVPAGHPGDGAKVARAECGTCHQETGKEYASGAHGAHAACTDCHDPHDVKGPEVLTAAQMNAACERCHERQGLGASHARWLPQTALHLAAVPCVGCHTGSPDFVVSMSVERRAAAGLAERLRRRELEGLLRDARGASTLVDADDDGYVSLEELRRFNLDFRGRGIQLQATLVPEHVTHTYGILRNRHDCTFCHAAGPSARQKGFVAIPEPGDRKVRRLPVEAGALLDLLYGTPDFYMIGATETRNPLMTGIAAALVGFGALFAAGHAFVRALTVRNRRGRRPGES